MLKVNFEGDLVEYHDDRKKAIETYVDEYGENLRGNIQRESRNRSSGFAQKDSDVQVVKRRTPIGWLLEFICRGNYGTTVSRPDFKLDPELDLDRQESSVYDYIEDEVGYGTD